MNEVGGARYTDGTTYLCHDAYEVKPTNSTVGRHHA